MSWRRQDIGSLRLESSKVALKEPGPRPDSQQSGLPRPGRHCFSLYFLPPAPCCAETPDWPHVTPTTGSTIRNGNLTW